MPPTKFLTHGSFVATVLVASACGAPPRPSSTPAPRRPSVATTGDAPVPASDGPEILVSAVDRILADAWTRRGIVPNPAADDATFLRRVTLDLVGTLPTPEEIEAFLADTSTDKKGKLVRGLVSGPKFAPFWSRYWTEALLGHARPARGVDREAFRAWLEESFRAGRGWDRVAFDVLRASGSNEPDPGDVSPSEPPNPAVAWTLAYVAKPADIAGHASRDFLGVQIQCAQCHDHKTESWKRTDFWNFASAFARVRVTSAGMDAKGAGARRVIVEDVRKLPPRAKNDPDNEALATAKPKALDGSLLDPDDPRAAMARWIVDRKNPWFARAFVNRMWGHFLGRGFVNPTDDMRPSNPPELPELEALLADDFASHGFDPRRLVSALALTRVYGLAAGDPEGEARGKEVPLWSRFRVTPLGPSELTDALLEASGTRALLEDGKPDALEALRNRALRAYGFLFDVDEDSDAPDYEGSMAGALAGLNGQLVAKATLLAPKSALFALVRDTKDDDAIVRALFLRTLGRPPREDERARANELVRVPPGSRPMVRAKGFEDLLWALLNSSEFQFNH